MHISYYLGLCALKQHQFKEAKDRAMSASFLQFAPAIDLMLRIEELQIGSKIQMDYSTFYSSILLSKVRDYFNVIPDVCFIWYIREQKIREGFVQKNIDQTLLYGLIGMDISIPYWGTHLINIYEKLLWKGMKAQFVFSAQSQVDLRLHCEMQTDQIYRMFMEYLLHISPANDHSVDVALSYIEGNHGFPQNVDYGKKMLETSKSEDAHFYLGYWSDLKIIDRVIHQDGQFAERNTEMAKMNFDSASSGLSMNGTQLLLIQYHLPPCTTDLRYWYRCELCMIQQGRCLWEKAKKHEWMEMVQLITKTILLNQDEIVYDSHCNIMYNLAPDFISRTEVKNNFNVDTLIQFIEKHVEAYGGGDELKKEIQSVKEMIQKEREKRKEKEKVEE